MLHSNKSSPHFRTYGAAPFNVVVVHGGPGVAGEMASPAAELAVDRGVLEPLQTASSVAGQVAELVDVIEKQGTSPVVLIGFSWGAWLSLMVAAQQPNDKQEIEPPLEHLAALPGELGAITDLLADNGCFSEENVTACEKCELTPFIAAGREEHHELLWDRFREPPPLPEGAGVVTRMKRRLRTTAEKAIYALRKTTSEPVFGIIKAVRGFRSFSMRGFEKAQGEWNLVCIAWNIKRLYALAT